MTTHHKAADQKSPSTSQMVFQPTLFCESQSLQDRGGGGALRGSCASPQHSQLNRKGSFRRAKGKLGVKR